MKNELDELLCKKYPKQLVNRHASEEITCMCWGFACGDGWFNILDQLMGNIQQHIDWSEKQRQYAIDYNAMATQAKSGNFDLFEKEYESFTNTEYKEKRLAEIVAGDFRKVPDVIPQVVLEQVKEKFGTLRFYYVGGDEQIHGMVRMAEAMTDVTCETCGAPGKRRGGGWVRTLCDEHEAEYEARRNQVMKESGFEE